MILTVFFVLSFLLAFVCLFLTKKSEKVLNATSWLLLSLLAVICMGFVVAGIIGLLPVPINLLTMSIIYLVIGLGFLIPLLLKKRIQKYRWNIYDILCIIAFALLAYVIRRVIFGDYCFVFKNSDAAVHFENAMHIVRKQKLSGMYFGSLYTGIMIEIFQPFVSELNYYKVFILADSLALMAELMFFFVLIRDYLDKKWKKALGLILCMFYLGGYPMVSYVQHFFYWGICAMLVGFVLLMVRYYRTKEIDRRWSVLFLMLGCAGVFLCYMLFVPMTYIATFLSLVVIAKQEGKVFTWRNVGLAFRIFLLPCVIGLYYCYFQWFFKSGMSVSGVMQSDGGTYAELYINFVLMFPLLVYWVIRRIKEKEITENLVFFLSFIVFILGAFVLVYIGKFSTYYYYKLYYLLWLMCFVVILLACIELAKRQWEMLVSLGVLVGFLGIMYSGKLDEKIMEKTTLTQSNHSQQFFDVYHFNRLRFGIATLYDDRLLDFCEYTIENREGKRKKMPLLADMDTYGYAYWYDAITGQHSFKYYGWCHKFTEIQEKIDSGACDYMVVLNFSDIYMNNKEYFDSFDRVMENEIGFIISTAKK